MESNEIRKTRLHVSNLLRAWRAKTNSENWTNFPDAYYAQQLGITKSQFSQYINCKVTMPLNVYLRMLEIIPKEVKTAVQFHATAV